MHRIQEGRRFLGTMLMAWAGLALCLYGTRAQISPEDSGQGILTLRGTDLILDTCKVSVAARPPAVQVTVQQELANPSSNRIEGILFIPVPEGCALSDFSFWMKGQKVSAEVMEKGEARRVFDGIVRRMKDPALLEYASHSLFRVHIFPVEPGERAKIEYSWTAPLIPEKDNWRVPLPLPPAPIRHLLIEGHAPRSVLKAYATELTVEGASGADAFAFSAKAEAFQPRPGFALHLVQARGPLGMAWLSYSEAGEDPYFLAILAPGSSEKDASPPKTVIFLLDTTGSMDGSNIAQAKKALSQGINILQDSDRFSIITFAEEAVPFTGHPEAATRENRAKARAFVDDIDPTGNTNLHAGLSAALAQAASETRPVFIILVTDGRSNEGPTDIPSFQTLLSKKSPNTRLFALGVSYEVNAALLDVSASAGRGTSSYVKPGEDLELPLTELFRKVARPVVTDLAVRFEGLDTYQVYPHPLPDLFGGESLILAGRCRGKVRGKMVLDGSASGRPLHRVYGVGGQSGADDINVPKLWATKRVGWLLEGYRAKPTEEVRKQITELAIQYGIITPLTSGLAREGDTTIRGGILGSAAVAAPSRPVYLSPGIVGSGVEGGVEGGIEGGVAGGILGGDSFKRETAAPEQSGIVGVISSVEVQQLKKTESMADSIPPTPPARGVAKGLDQAPAPREEPPRTVGSHTFYLQEGSWVDSEFKAGMKEKRIRYLSKEYSALFDANPNLKGVMALGDRVKLVLNKVAILIGP